MFDEDESAPKEMVEEIPNCPICGAKPYLNGCAVDGFWFGWFVGCPRYCLNDGIHGHNDDTPSKERFAAHGFDTKEDAAKWWEKRVKSEIERTSHYE